MSVLSMSALLCETITFQNQVITGLMGGASSITDGCGASSVTEAVLRALVERDDPRTDENGWFDHPDGRLQVRTEGQIVCKGELVVLKFPEPRGAHQALAVYERAVLWRSLRGEAGSESVREAQRQTGKACMLKGKGSFPFHFRLLTQTCWLSGLRHTVHTFT